MLDINKLQKFLITIFVLFIFIDLKIQKNIRMLNNFELEYIIIICYVKA